MIDLKKLFKLNIVFKTSNYLKYNRMDSIGIHWIPLKLTMLPFIIQEVDKVIEKFFSYIIRAQR